MKILTKLALASVILIAATSAQAEWVSGHFRSSGTYVAPYYRTPANGIPYDNLSYRGYPSQQPGYVAPRSWSFGSDLNQPRTMPNNRLSSPNHTYSYRNPFAASPSVSVRGYYRSSGTYVEPHFRTSPNWTITDNLSYRGYGTIRVPRY